jgi:threonine dehydrogenase-like Zn-dependent dehydrogenase
MQALVYNGPGQKNLQDHPKPAITTPTDAIVKITKTTICGTDLHILKGDVATCRPGTVLGHEGVGVVDAVGPGVATFKLCEDIVAAGGTVANVGVHGSKVDLHLERLWSHNVTITTRLVDKVSIPMLLKTVQSKRIDAKQLITHRFELGQILQAYDAFSKAAETKALKVIIAT